MPFSRISAIVFASSSAILGIFHCFTTSQPPLSPWLFQRWIVPLSDAPVSRTKKLVLGTVPKTSAPSEFAKTFSSVSLDKSSSLATSFIDVGGSVSDLSASDSKERRSSTLTSASGSFSFADHLALDSVRPAILIGIFTSLPDSFAVR